MSAATEISRSGEGAHVWIFFAQAVSALRSLDSHRDRAIVLAMLLGGLRAAEVRGLQLSDVDLNRPF